MARDGISVPGQFFVPIMIINLLRGMYVQFLTDIQFITCPVCNRTIFNLIFHRSDSSRK